MDVFVLLYNIGTKNEGIHTIKYGDCNTVLIFESEVGANYFALMLEAYGFPKPTVESLDDEDIKEICLDSGYDYEFIPAELVAVPPENHAEPSSSSYWEAKSQNSSLIKLPSSHLNSNQKEYYLTTLREMYFLYKRNIADLQLERARKGFSVEINRQIEYYMEELQKIEVEIQRW